MYCTGWSSFSNCVHSPERRAPCCGARVAMANVSAECEGLGGRIGGNEGQSHILLKNYHRKKTQNCIIAFGNDCSFHAAPGFPLLFQRSFPKVGNILHEVAAVIFLTCVNSTDTGHASRLSLQSFAGRFMCDETQKLFSLPNPQTSAGVPWTRSSDFTGEEPPLVLLYQHGGSQNKVCSNNQTSWL